MRMTRLARGARRILLAAGLVGLMAGALAACGGSIDPDRPPLPPEYEPPPIDGAPRQGPPSRV